MRGFDRLPFWAALPLLAALLVGGIYAGFLLHSIYVTLGAVVAVSILAAVFLLDYSQRPMVTPVPRPGASALEAAMTETVPGIEDETESYDPVIEADRIAAGEVLPDVVEDDEEPPEEPSVGP